MLQVRSILDVADNSGAKRAAAIGVIGRNQRYAIIGDVIKAHIKEAAPDGTVKKGDVVDAVVVRTRQPIRRGDLDVNLDDITNAGITLVFTQHADVPNNLGTGVIRHIQTGTNLQHKI